MEIIRTLLMLFLFGISLLMIFLILIQKSKGGGMGSAFGGGGSDSILGPAGGNKITMLTTVLAVVFIGISLFLSFFMPAQRQERTVVRPDTLLTAPPAPPGGEAVEGGDLALPPETDDFGVPADSVEPGS